MFRLSGPAALFSKTPHLTLSELYRSAMHAVKASARREDSRNDDCPLKLDWLILTGYWRMSGAIRVTSRQPRALQ
jgi:hypothetical protein